jgi:hypothetical protein
MPMASVFILRDFIEAGYSRQNNNFYLSLQLIFGRDFRLFVSNSSKYLSFAKNLREAARLELQLIVFCVELP